MCKTHPRFVFCLDMSLFFLQANCYGSGLETALVHIGARQ